MNELKENELLWSSHFKWIHDLMNSKLDSYRVNIDKYNELVFTILVSVKDNAKYVF